MTAMTGENEFETSRDFHSVKLEYFKTKAREALARGNHREAYETYTKCLKELAPKDANERARLLSNRSMAYAKSANYKAALEDANAAISASPNFAKAWWRKASAHVGLRQFPDALSAYKVSLERQVEGEEGVFKEHVKSINRTITSFTREQLGNWILEELTEMEKRELIEPAHLERVTSLEMLEGMFRQIKTINEHSNAPGDYYRFVQHWSVYGMSVPMAYIQRAGMYRNAMCFKQARTDAAAALILLQDDPSIAVKEEEMSFTYKMDDFAAYSYDKVIAKAWAWFEMGGAYEEEGAGDVRSAAKCFGAISQLGVKYPQFANAFKSICSRMKDIDAGTVLSDINDQFCVAEYGLRTTVTGAVTYLVSVAVQFRSGTLVDFSSRTRDCFRESVAAAATVGKDKVLIENVRADEQQGIAVTYRIMTGEDKLKSEELVIRAQSLEVNLLGGSQVEEIMGKPSHVSSEVKELRTEDFVDHVNSLQRIILSTLKSGKEIVVAERPPKEMELPYRTYKLVYNDGVPVERINKSGYMMSQVHYSAQGMHKREVWAEMMDKSCRWHQSSSEIAVQALRVPKDAKKQDLDVCITTSTVRVSCRTSGRTYLEGELFRPIIPEESAWVHLGGEDDDGFVLYLKKMNLELFKGKDSKPSDSWWDRLFNSHGDIRFDDYDKDFTDLPAPIAETIARREALSDVTSRIEEGEHQEREKARERDDLRKRSRQERLAQLRGGKFLNWVDLNRRNPEPNPLANNSGGD
ncbi:Tetratricopeptide repeat [Ostreococcus tauri]|uniref:Tetratricopeptide repeat n=1 Tax=Ostreococcus tauri TaxID=70448 RepID=A0A090M8E2_OSTTA|nr:Tetratricopeptide repeat [Ostreococcus tauri]CEF98972.1 Tetratricopeptide repeat [Ostreococcus tauri]|eukprot:XP_022839573.1 Tetratricopeptide repeat [Ostreococcus tauri]